MERSAPPVTRERTLCETRRPRVRYESSYLARFRLGFRNIEGVTRRKYTSSTDRTPSLLYRDPFSDTTSRRISTRSRRWAPLTTRERA